MKLEDISRPAPTVETVEDTVRSIESSVERLADSGEADEEIRRVVTDTAEASASKFEEPTRQFASSNTSSPASQFSFDNIRFGK